MNGLWRYPAINPSQRQNPSSKSPSGRPSRTPATHCPHLPHHSRQTGHGILAGCRRSPTWSGLRRRTGGGPRKNGSATGGPRAAGGFTGRANSALPLGDPGLPLDDALTVVSGWYRARGLAPMIAVPMPLDDDSPRDASASGEPSSSGAPASNEAGGPGGELDAELARRSWPTRPGPAFFMVADLPLAWRPPRSAGSTAATTS